MFSIDTPISDAGWFLIAIFFLVEGVLFWKIGSPQKQIDWIRHTEGGKNAFKGIAIVFLVFVAFTVIGFFTLAEASTTGETRISEKYIGPVAPIMLIEDAEKTEKVYKASNRLTFFPYFYVEAALDTPLKSKPSPQCESGGDQVASNLRLVLGIIETNRFSMFGYIGHQSCAVGEDYLTEDTAGLGTRLYFYKQKGRR